MSLVKQSGAIVIAAERLYLNAAQDKVLREGEAGAATLLAAKGQQVPARFVKLMAQEQAPEAQTVAPEVIERRSRRPARVDVTR